jgi:hypothetical protein
MIGMISVTTVLATKSLLRFAVTGTSVAASCALLRGLVGRNLKPSFASPVELVLETFFEAVPTHIKDRLVKA